MNTSTSFHFHKFNDILYTNNKPITKTSMCPIESNTINNHTNEYLQTFAPFTSLDLLKEIKNNQLASIEPLIPLILNKQIEPSANFSLSNLISIFQLLLKFLYNAKENIQDENETIEQYTKNITGIDNQIEENKKKLENQRNLIRELNTKYKRYQTIINAKSDFITKNKRLYFCDVCKYAKFNDYESLHNHYTKCHIDPNAVRGDTSYVNFNQIYFNQQINELENECKELIVNIDRNKREKFNKEYDELKFSMTNSFRKAKKKSGKLSTSNLREYHNLNQFGEFKGDVYNTDLMKSISNLQLTQQKKFDMLVEQFKHFKEEILNSIKVVSNDDNKK